MHKPRNEMKELKKEDTGDEKIDLISIIVGHEKISLAKYLNLDRILYNLIDKKFYIVFITNRTGDRVPFFES